MKVYLDPSTVFGGGRQNSVAQPDEAVRLLKKALRKAEKAIEEGKKPKDDKKKEEEKKNSPLDIFLLITCLSFLAITGETWMIISYFTHIVEILHK